MDIDQEMSPKRPDSTSEVEKSSIQKEELENKPLKLDKTPSQAMPRRTSRVKTGKYLE